MRPGDSRTRRLRAMFAKMAMGMGKGKKAIGPKPLGEKSFRRSKWFKGEPAWDVSAEKGKKGKKHK